MHWQESITFYSTYETPGFRNKIYVPTKETTGIVNNYTLFITGQYSLKSLFSSVNAKLTTPRYGYFIDPLCQMHSRDRQRYIDCLNSYYPIIQLTAAKRAIMHPKTFQKNLGQQCIANLRFSFFLLNLWGQIIPNISHFCNFVFNNNRQIR